MSLGDKPIVDHGQIIVKHNQLPSVSEKKNQVVYLDGAN